MKPNISEIVRIALYNHPKDCIFTENAYEMIIVELESDPELFAHGESILIDKIEEAIRRQEIYCQHEGIDRRGSV